MTLPMHHNHLKINKFRIAFLLLLLSCVVFQTQSIKFFNKKTQQKPIPQSQTASPPKVQKQDLKQTKSSQPTQSSIKDDTKPTQQQQKPMQIKPQVSTITTASSAPKPQSKPQPKKSTENSLDSLFGQSTSSKPNPTPSTPSLALPAMTIKPEEHKSDPAPVPSSSPTFETKKQPQKKAKQPNNMIGSLFGEQNGKKPKKTVTLKEEKPAVLQKAKVEPTFQPTVDITPQKTQVDTKPLKSQDTKVQKAPQTNENTQKSQKTTQQKKNPGQVTTKVGEQDKTQQKKAKTQQKSKSQQESSDDVKQPSSQKKKSTQDDSEPEPKQQKAHTSKQTNDEQDSQIDQQPHKTQPKTKQQDSQSQSQQIIYPKKSPKNPKTKQSSTSTQQNPQDANQKYSLTLFLTFCIYSLIIVLVVITIKFTSSSSKVVKAVGIMLDAVGDMFKKRQGYRPALNQEEVTEREEEITVGYNVQENNKQIFWEKNSVEGI